MLSDMSRSHTAAVILTAVALAATSALASAQPFDGDPATVSRIDADTPVAAAVAVAQLRFPTAGSAEGAVLATDSAFADAMTGASLTADAPLLLTGGSTLDPDVADELTRSVPPGATVTLLGGEVALSEDVADDVRDLGFVVRRLSGDTRFETAEAVARARAAENPVPEILLARGVAPADNPTAAWADAIAASAAGLRPILLTTSDALHPSARAFITDTPGAAVTLLGGLAALSDQVEQDATTATTATVDRVMGDTRDGTAAAIADRFLGVTTDTPNRRATFFTGFETDGWAYGLAGSALAREQGAPLLPVNIAALAQATAIVAGCGAGPADVLVVGSAAVVPQVTVDAHRGCPPSAQPQVLDGAGVLPAAPFGPDVATTIDALTAALGPATDDTGWVEGCPFDSDGDLNERFVSFGDLTAVFNTRSGAERFVSWRYDLPGDPALTTRRDITVSSTNDDVRIAYPSATYADGIFGPMWEIDETEDGPMFFFPADGADATPVGLMFGGTEIFCD